MAKADVGLADRCSVMARADVGLVRSIPRDGRGRWRREIIVLLHSALVVRI
jgi:hypothetical protein